MKYSILKISLISLFAVGSVFLSSCGGSEEPHDHSSHEHPDANEGDHGHGAKDDHAHDHGSHASSGHMEHMNDVLNNLKEELGDAYDTPVPPATEEQLVSGEASYTKFCVSCHGESGKGDGPLSASLESPPADFTDDAHSKFYSDQGRIHIIKKGVEGTQMVAWEASLSEDEISDVYAYVRSLRVPARSGGHGHSNDDGGHSHGSPHGGVVKSAGAYHIEMVSGEKNLSFYLLDGSENTVIIKDITGTAILQVEGGSTATHKLTANGKDHFSVDLNDSSSAFICIVSFKIDGETVTAKFKKDGSEGEEKHDDHGEHGGHDHEH